jgi:hypothetical protein
VKKEEMNQKRTLESKCIECGRYLMTSESDDYCQQCLLDQYPGADK